jgi:hypothetical protein
LSISLLARAAALLGFSVSAMPAAAAMVVVTPDADITTTPYTITFEPGESLSFSNVAATSAAPDAAIGVQTSGGAEVFSSFGEPAYFQTFATSAFPSQQLGGFSPYATPAGVPYSIAEGLVGFEYALNDGVHYGIADIGGSTVYKYYLDSVPGQSFSLAVPEPATWALLLVGFGLTGSALRRANDRRRMALATIPVRTRKSRSPC